MEEFESAYYEYDQYFKKNKNETNCLVLIADAAMKISNIMDESDIPKQAYKYVQTACDTFIEIYGNRSDNTILAQSLKLQIEYTLSTEHNTHVFMKSVELLFQSLKERDQYLEEDYDMGMGNQTEVS